MKHIKPINEFFDFLRKDGEEDDMAKVFIQRLEKVKDENPYKIESINKDELPANFGYADTYDYFYKIVFDDVPVIIARGVSTRSGAGLYKIMVDDENLYCKDKYTKKIYNLVSEILQREKNDKRISKLRQNINPSADRL